MGKEKVDLLVLDLQMPGMDQMDLFAILREKYPAIPALVVSGVYTGVVENFVAKGYDTTTFFNKPAPMIELKKSVFKLLKIDALGTFHTDQEIGITKPGPLLHFKAKVLSRPGLRHTPRLDKMVYPGGALWPGQISLSTRKWSNKP